MAVHKLGKSIKENIYLYQYYRIKNLDKFLYKLKLTWRKN
jgi:hypothetical protein